MVTNISLEKYLKIGNMLVIMESPESEEYIGSSKFDKLRRVSVIKPVADKMGLREGDEVSFYSRGSEIIIRKRITQDLNQDQIIINFLNEVRYNMELYYDENGEPAYHTHHSEDFNPGLFYQLDRAHQNKLFDMIHEEVAKKIEEYIKVHNK